MLFPVTRAKNEDTKFVFFSLISDARVSTE